MDIITSWDEQGGQGTQPGLMEDDQLGEGLAIARHGTRYQDLLLTHDASWWSLSGASANLTGNPSALRWAMHGVAARVGG
jgi:hypothetical protein